MHWALRRILKISWTEKKTCSAGLSWKRTKRHDRDRNNAKSTVRGRKRMKWREIGKSVTGIKEFKTLKENAEDRGKWRKYLKEANLHS